MGRRINMKPEDAFKYIPPELCFGIFSYLDMESFRAVRSVSKRWKLLADSSRNLAFTCDLTDMTLGTVTHSTETFSCVRVHDFNGEGNKVVSSTRGTGRVFACAEAIHLIGHNINAVEIGKMIQYAMQTVNELLFHHCSCPVLVSVFHLQKPFESLRRLTLCHNFFPCRRETAVLEDLGSANVASQLPLLENFKVIYEMDPAATFLSPSPTGVFANYLAVAGLVLRYKDSLRTVDVERNDMLLAPFLFLFFTDVRLSWSQRDQLQECLAGFHETKLDSLRITTLLNEGTHPWTLETALMQQQRILKDLTFDNRFCILNENQTALQSLLNALPASRQFLTNIKVCVRCSGNETVDLSVFSQCPSLKTLGLVFFGRTRMNVTLMNKLNFTNVDQLPITITSLHFKASPEDPLFIQHQSILSLEQIQWIIANLKHLESLWLQLVTEEQIENGFEDQLNNNQDEDEDDQWDGGDIQDFPPPRPPPPPPPNERLQIHINMDVHTFRELISMPKLRDMKFDMLIAGEHRPIWEFEVGPRYLAPLQSISPVDIQDYIDVCEQDQRIMFNDEEIEIFPFRFHEISITRRD